MQALRQDIAYALRQMRFSPIFNTDVSPLSALYWEVRNTDRSL